MAFESGNIPKETLDYLAAKKAESDKSLRTWLLVGCIVAFFVAVLTVINSGDSTAKPQQAAVMLDAPLLPYHPDETIAQAKKDMAKKQYQLVVDELEGLHSVDSKRPGVQSMVSKAKHEVELAHLKEMRLARLAYAKDYERSLLGEGMDATVRATGQNAETLSITFVLVNRPLVYKLENDRDMAKTLLSYGFTDVRLSDGFDSSWSYKLD